MVRLLLAAIFVTLVGLPLTGARAWERPKVIDFHAHLDPSAGARIKGILDRSGIELIVNLSGGSFPWEWKEAQALSTELGGRVINFYTPDWDEIDDPAWGLAEAFRLDAAVKRFGFAGLKIAKALGLYVRDAAQVLVDVDDPRLDPLWAKAGELGVPVCIHVGDPKAFWRPSTPDNERYEELQVHPRWSFYGEPVPSQEALLDQLARVVARHPLTTFVAVHFGNDPEDPGYVERMLERFPNYFIDVAARVPEIGRHDPARMRALFTRFQDRILFATDLGVGRYGIMLGSTGTDAPTDDDAARFYATHWRYFETHDRQFEHPTPIQGKWKIDAVGLPPEVLDKIYRKNALKLLRRGPA